MWRSSVFLGGQPCPSSKGRGYSVSEIFCDLCLRQNVVTQVGQARVSRGTVMPLSQGGGALASAEIFGTPYTYARTV